MGIWLVLPLKSLHEGKSRLSPALGPTQRAELIAQMLDHILEQARVFPGLSRTLLVSACSAARDHAARRGAHVLTENALELNAALGHARAYVRAMGADQLMIAPCDLPLVSHDDLRELAAGAPPGGAAIAPDSRHEGTNGLYLPIQAELSFSFGPRSFSKHVGAIERLGLKLHTLERPGLAFDIDTPQDFARLCEFGARAQLPSHDATR